MVNVNKLRGKIVECGMNIEETAEAAGIKRGTFYNRLNDPQNFTSDEADALANVLHLTRDECIAIFFAQYVQ